MFIRPQKIKNFFRPILVFFNMIDLLLIIFTGLILYFFPYLKENRVLFSTVVIICLALVLFNEYFFRKSYLDKELNNLKRIISNLDSGKLDIQTTGLLSKRKNETIQEMDYKLSKFGIKLQGLINHLKLIANNINQSSYDIDEQLISYIKDIKNQIYNIDVTFNSANEIHEFITDITGSIEKLSQISEENISFLKQIIDHNDNVNIKMESLSAYVEETSEAMADIIAHTGKVTYNTENLSSLAVETATSIMQMDATITEIEKQAKITEDLSREVMGEAKLGLEQTNNTAHAIQNISVTFDNINEKINELKSKSKKIGAITNTINKISEQTSLLALNAAISSSHNDASDKNFAVIAEKIRELASSSSLAMKEISEIANSLQVSIEESYGLMKTGNTTVKKGVELISETTVNFTNIVQKLNRVNDSFIIMSNATSEHVEGSSQVSKATQEISSMTEEIADLMLKEEDIVKYVNNKTTYVGELANSMKQLINMQNSRTDKLLTQVKELGSKTRRIFSQSEELSLNNKKILNSIHKIQEISNKNYKNSSLMTRTSIDLKKYSNYLNNQFKHFTSSSNLYGGTLKIGGLKLSGVNFDPMKNSNTDDGQILSLMHSGLVKYDQIFNVVPDIAQSWTTSENGLEYTFKLKNNVFFHNGQNLTSSDVESSFKRLLDPVFDNAAAGIFFIIQGAEEFNKNESETISGIEIIDDYTIRFALTKPLIFFTDLLALGYSYILPQTEYIQKDPDKTPMTGAGPFEIVELNSDKHVIFRKHKDYHFENQPYVNRVVFQMKTSSDKFEDFLNGDLDILMINDPDDLTKTEQNEKLKEHVIDATQISTFFIAFNCEKPPFDNPNIRKALSFAINRNQICNEFPLKLATPAYSIIPPGMPGHNQAITGIEYDPEKAKWMLDNFNFDMDTEIELTFAQHTSDIPIDIQVIAENFRELGLNVVMNGLNNHWKIVNEKQHAMFRVGWIADYPDPDNFIYSIFSKHSGDVFKMSFNNAKIEELTEKGKYSLDPRERILIYEQIEKLHGELCPLIPLYHKKDAILKNLYLNGVNLKGFAPAVDVDIISFNTIT